MFPHVSLCTEWYEGVIILMDWQDSPTSSVDIPHWLTLHKLLYLNFCNVITFMLQLLLWLIPPPTPLTINIELVIPLFYFWIVTELMAGLHYWSRSLIMSPLPTIKNYQELLNYKSLSHYTLSLRDKVRAATRHVLTSTNISNCSNSQLTQTVGKQNG